MDKISYGEWYHYFEYGGGNGATRSMHSFLRESARRLKKYGSYFPDEKKVKELKRRDEEREKEKERIR